MPHYSNAPITEAVLDIRVRLSPEATLSQLEAVRVPLYEPHGRPLQFNVQVQLHEPSGAEAPSISHSVDATGFQYKKREDEYVFQVRRDGFSLNRLIPYQTWDLLKAEAQSLWPLYRDQLNPQLIELLGLTYVNTIHLPSGAQLEDYLSAFISVPKDLPQQLSDFSLSFQGEDSTRDVQVRVMQNGAPPLADGRSTIILTIQTFKAINVEPDMLSDAKLWAILDNLREAKNVAFEACITDLLRKDFY